MSPKNRLRLILVVRAAAELDVVRRGCASSRVRLDVMKLEERGLVAPACPSHERAATLIALPHVPPDRRRYVASRCRTVARARARRRRTGKPAPLEMIDRAASTRDRESSRRRHPAPRVGQAPVRAAASRASRASALPVACIVPARVASRRPRGTAALASQDLVPRPEVLASGSETGVESCFDGCGATRRIMVAAAGRGFNDAISS